MARGYLNSLSFPATDVKSGLELLSELREGIARLIKAEVIAPPVMCALRASQLPLSPDYVTLPHAAKTHGAQFRDTILFFLTALDQRSPVHVALPPEDQEEARPSVVDDAECDFDPEAATVLVSCALDDGVLLSLGSSDRWRTPDIEVRMLTASAETERQVKVCNVHNAPTADAAHERRATAMAAHRFENWEHLTGDARRAPQLDDWFAECRTRPGLEQVVMRSLALARAQGWLPDGDLVKKLNAKSSSPVFEVRAWYNGSNNVRVLFGRTAAGSVAVGFGGTKTSPDWYDNAIPQADRFISER